MGMPYTKGAAPQFLDDEFYDHERGMGLGSVLAPKFVDGRGRKVLGIQLEEQLGLLGLRILQKCFPQDKLR